MSGLDMRSNEREWSARWEHAFEADPAEKEKYYLTVAFPYPSGAMHVGHGRTYIVPDVIARYQRMKGRQVLFPMAFHVTGTPVIGISKRIANGDEQTIGLYRDLYRVPQDILDRFINPMEIVRYFSEEYQRVMQKCGLSIDWRRRFITVDPQYSKFIEWQYAHLHEEEHVVKGAHPVKYCPQCENPVGDHDLLEGRWELSAAQLERVLPNLESRLGTGDTYRTDSFFLAGMKTAAGIRSHFSPERLEQPNRTYPQAFHHQDTPYQVFMTRLPQPGGEDLTVGFFLSFRWLERGLIPSYARQGAFESLRSAALVDSQQLASLGREEGETIASFQTLLPYWKLRVVSDPVPAGSGSRRELWFMALSAVMFGLILALGLFLFIDNVGNLL